MGAVKHIRADAGGAVRKTQVYPRKDVKREAYRGFFHLTTV
jgi:hypothetical protein